MSRAIPDGGIPALLRGGWARVGSVSLLIAGAIGLAGGVGGALIGARLSPLMVVAGVCAAGAVACFLRFPVTALYALAFAVPIERFGRITDDTSAFSLSVARGLGFLALVALIPVLVMRRHAPFINTPLLLWCAFTTMGLTTLLSTSDLTPGVRIASGYIGNILFLLTVMNLALGDSLEETRRRVNTSILLWLIASTGIALYSTWDWHFGSGQQGGIPISEVDPQAGAQLAQYRWSTVWLDRAEMETLGGLSIRRSMGSTSHAAVFGINLAMSIPFFFYFIKHTRSRIFWLLMWVGLAASLYCTLLTNTRATLVLAAGVLGLCVLLKLVKITPILLLLGAGGAMIAPFMLPVDIFDRVLDWRNYTTGKSAAMQIRLDYWSAGFRAISDHWLMGNGLANQRVVLDYLRNPIEGKSHMHNIYLQTLMDVGVLGWGLFIAFLVSTVHACVRARRAFLQMHDRRDADMLTAGLVLTVAVLVFGLQVDVFYFPLKAWWLIIGLVFVMGRFGIAGATGTNGGSPQQHGIRLQEPRPAV